MLAQKTFPVRSIIKGFALILLKYTPEIFRNEKILSQNLLRRFIARESFFLLLVRGGE